MDYQGHDRKFERNHPADAQRSREEAGAVITGRTVNDATEDACRRFGVSRDQLKISVLEGGSKGFLGILGSKPATLRVQLTPGAIPVYAETVLAKILKEMGLPDKIKRKKDSDGNLILDIQGPSGGVLIGRHGQTLEALQYMVSKILQHVAGDNKELVIVDVESYRERQSDKLKELARNLAKKAKETCEEVSLRPMNARDRRIVHMTLKDDQDVTTQSRGEGLRRRVVVIPKNLKEKPSSGTEAPVQEETAQEPSVPSSDTDPELPSSDTDPELPLQAPTEPSTGKNGPGEDNEDNIGNR